MLQINDLTFDAWGRRFFDKASVMIPAGAKVGVWPDADRFAKRWALDRRFEPAMDGAERRAKLKGWRDAVRRTLS